MPSQITIQPTPPPVDTSGLDHYEAWTVDRPDHVIVVAGANEFVAKREAFLKFGCRFESVRVRRWAPRLTSLGVC